MTEWFWTALCGGLIVALLICLRGWMNAVDELCRVERCRAQAVEALREARDFIAAMGDD